MRTFGARAAGRPPATAALFDPLVVLLAFATLGLTACEGPSSLPEAGASPGTSSASAGDAAGERPTLAWATPEDVGMSSQRLTRLHEGMQQLLDEGRLAGITTMVARRGRVVDFRTYGHRSLEAGDPMEEDAIFRIYSMSKPITGVALMTLYEEGRFRLSDPVERYIPEFADLRVVASWGAEGPVLVDADHPMTIRELMSHTAGLAYGIGAPGPVDSLYQARGVLSRSQTLRDMIGKLADIPLRHQPGTQWYYSIAVDVQGYLVEVLSGQPFDEFLQNRIFGPLGMVDTGFHVPEDDHHRFVEYYGYDENGGLIPTGGSGAEVGSRPYLDPTTFFSGGGGLVSTTSDYMRFALMLQNGGELDGVRILSPTTVELMTRNHMPRDNPERSPGQGFGLDFSVVLDPVWSEFYSVGEFYWGGAAGTWFWVDPAEELVFVGMIQQRGGARRPDVRSLSHRLTYQAITETTGEVEPGG